MRIVLALLMVVSLGRSGWAADKLRIGLLHTLSPAPLYLAMQRGYFRDEGLDASSASSRRRSRSRRRRSRATSMSASPR